MISSLKRPERGCAWTTASRSASVNSENALDHTRPALLETDVLMQEHRLAAGASYPLHHGSAAGIVQVSSDHLGVFKPRTLVMETEQALSTPTNELFFGSPRVNAIVRTCSLAEQGTVAVLVIRNPNPAFCRV
jgi:hypothetical protein